MRILPLHTDRKQCVIKVSSASREHYGHNWADSYCAWATEAAATSDVPPGGAPTLGIMQYRTGSQAGACPASADREPAEQGPEDVPRGDVFLRLEALPADPHLLQHTTVFLLAHGRVHPLFRFRRVGLHGREAPVDRAAAAVRAVTVGCLVNAIGALGRGGSNMGGWSAALTGGLPLRIIMSPAGYPAIMRLSRDPRRGLPQHCRTVLLTFGKLLKLVLAHIQPR